MPAQGTESSASPTAADQTAGATTSSTFRLFSFWDDPSFSHVERILLFVVLGVAVAGLAYAYWLTQQVKGADQGTQKMQQIAAAIREGADAYLKKQLGTVAVLVLVLVVVLFLSKALTSRLGMSDPFAWGRAAAFLMGAVFSATVGFVGMRLATSGNLRVASAATVGFGRALMLGYRTGTITGMLTDGLGLLGGTLIFMAYGEHAYEALLGFGFGGTLLALFMRVGGGIYTKAADVGADLVGKVEKDIPEDDPRNAATIADNVGDNVGDCAGMAADVFESYTVTMVAAMILGYAAFGTKAMLLPLFIQAVGILSSAVSTALVGRRESAGGASGAMKAINNSFRVGAGLSVIGVLALGAVYLKFDRPYIITQAVERGLYKVPEFQAAVGLPTGVTPHEAVRAWKHLPEARKNEVAETGISRTAEGVPVEGQTVYTEADRLVPVHEGIDLRPAFTCLVGIALTLALMFCTEYWTSTEYHPVRSITKNSRTGDATNIIQGIAVGYESTVWAVILIAAAVFAGVFIYQESNSPLFIAYGVSLAGIGMLALTGDTLSMDVFGPVADNANGIGEMGYNFDPRDHRRLSPSDPDYVPEDDVRQARQILTDLDATGNTTKAITKGIAIGSAVIAAVSLFASFIAVLVKGSEERINELTAADFHNNAGLLSVAKPEVFIGMLIGGAVPFLFSSMTIRAVGRAAYLIVNECRRQFRDEAIWAGTKKPDYGRVVDICTGTAQRELVGPGLLAIFTPILVGFLLGPYALGGFLAGMIVVGQLLAVFMATAGGAWDNAKKMIEDQERTEISGKGSPQHKASVTGDTVGDPLKDTAGPAINPLIKVMNMVSLLVLPLVLTYNIKQGTHSNSPTGYFVILVGLLAVSWSWWQSKRDTIEMRELDEEYERDLEAARKRKREVVREAAPTA